MSSGRIVVVEDESDIYEVIAYNLEREGYEVLHAADGTEGLELVRRAAPDLVVLDIMLPGVDGVEVCRRLRADALTESIPIVMVTARGDEADVVLGLGVGADDYVPKPFSPRELVARVRAVLRRARRPSAEAASERVVRGPLVVDPVRHEVRVDGRPVRFTVTELRLLHVLASHPGRAFTRDHLLTRVIGHDAVVIDRNIDVHVRSIRRKLGPHRDLIETVRGVGYRFRDVTDAGGEDA